MRRFVKFKLAFWLIILITSGAAFSQENEKRLLTQEDVENWERLSFRTDLTDDGEWLAYYVSRNSGDNTLYLKGLNSGKEKAVPYASMIGFSEDANWFAWKTGVSAQEREKLQKADKEVPFKIVLMNLQTFDTTAYDNITQLGFSPNSNFITYTIKKKEGDKSEGDQLVVKGINDDRSFYFNNVVKYAWRDKSDDLALAISSDSPMGSGVQLFQPVTGKITPLLTDQGDFQQVLWRRDNNDLLVVSKTEMEGFKESTLRFWVLNGVATSKMSIKSFDPLKNDAFPSGHYIINRGYNLSEDGSRIYFSIFPASVKEDSTVREINDIFHIDEAPDVQIWHSGDNSLISQQEKSSLKTSDHELLCAWDVITNKFISIQDEETNQMYLSVKRKVQVGTSNLPYIGSAMFGRPNHDLFLFDEEGRKTVIDKKIYGITEAWSSEDYVVYVKDHQFNLLNLNTVESRVISLPEGYNFFDLDDDHPTLETRPYGMGTWFREGGSFLIYSKYDTWYYDIRKDQLTRLSRGKETETRYRYANIYMGERDRYERSPSVKNTIYLRGINDRTKGTSIVTTTIKGDPKEVYSQNASISITGKADKSGDILFTQQTYDQPSNLYHTNEQFRNPVRISDVNSNQDEFYWSKAELIEYNNHEGKKLQAILNYPANYEQGKKYPMITYIYEKLSGGFNYYDHPSITDYYNTAMFTQAGYFVLRPDIEFSAADPGISSARSLEAAVGAVVELGLVDAEKVGLVGHSWGGYQAAYVPTQTDVFAASVAGAGLTNLISMYGAITPAFGGASENGHFEVGQERMTGPPWELAEAYIRNSPVMQIEKLNTPILVEVGDNDMNVNWRQGAEYYNAARRAGKQMVMLVYANEGHGLRNKKNQVDYHNRIMQWFGHYLKGEAAPEWITEGIPLKVQNEILSKWEKDTKEKEEK